MSKLTEHSLVHCTFFSEQKLPSHLAPGGYLEHSECNPVMMSDDGTIREGDIFDDGGKRTVECGLISGKRLDIQSEIKNLIVDAGFVEVREHKYKWPLGDWPADPRLKEVGIINARHWNEGIEGWTMRLMTRSYGVSLTSSTAIGSVQRSSDHVISHTVVSESCESVVSTDARSNPKPELSRLPASVSSALPCLSPR